MDWISGIVSLLGVVLGGGSAFMIYREVKFRRQAERKEDISVRHADIEAHDLDITAAGRAVETISKMQEEHQRLLEKVKQMAEKLDKYRRATLENERIINKQEYQIGLLVEIAERQIGRKEYAERNLCQMVDCKLRTPPMGTYRSSSDTTVLMKLVEELKKEEKEEGKEVENGGL